MKLFTFLFLSFCISACSQSVQSSYFIPQDYDLSYDEIGKGKTYVYQNPQNGQESFLDIKIISKSGKKYRMEKQYNSSSISDSAIIYYGRTIELYNFFMSGDGKIIEGEKLLDTLMRGNEKIGTLVTKWRYRTSDILYSTSSQLKFIKDTTMNWADRELACIVLQADTDIILQLIDDKETNHLTEVASKLYFAKGVGLIKFLTEFTDHKGLYNNTSWNLKTIKELQ